MASVAFVFQCETTCVCVCALLDVWSFGVMLWELFSYGMIPYASFSNVEVVTQVMTGYRLSPPIKCPREISKAMLSCWNQKPEHRPTFKALYDVIDSAFTELKNSLYVTAPSGGASKHDALQVRASFCEYINV